MEGRFDFNETFKLSYIALHLNRSHPGINRNKFWKMQYLFLCLMSAVTLALLVYTILLNIPAGQFSEASKNSCLMIICITINVKFIILNYHRNAILNLIKVVENDYKESSELCDTEIKIVKEYSLRGTTVCKLWLFTSVSTTTLLILTPIFMMTRLYFKGEFHFIPVIEIYYPQFAEVLKNVPVYFWMTFCFQSFVAIFSGTMYVGFDPLVPIFLLHSGGQLEILSDRMRTIFTATATKSKIQHDLRKIILKLQEIYRFIDCVKACFTILFEYNMKATTFILPLTAFQILENLRHKKVSLEFVTMFFGCVIHFYIPCYYSDLLIDKSEKFRQAVYCSGWEKYPYGSARTTILFMLTRAIRPLVISTVFYPICLNVFAEMCRQAYAIFNIMYAAWSI